MTKNSVLLALEDAIVAGDEDQAREAAKAALASGIKPVEIMQGGVARGMGRMVSKLIKDVAEGGLFRTPILGADQGMVISLGVQNLDLAIAQDLITAYMGNEGLDHSFRVMESLVLRIKHPGAICVLA